MEKTLHEKILSGVYKDEYIVYTRKSTDEDNNQKNSLSYQKRENLSFSTKNNLKIANIDSRNFCTGGIISEKHSGFKESDVFNITDEGQIQYQVARPKFYQMVQYLNRGCFKGFVCLSYDRLSRNKSDNAIIGKLRSQGVDIRFVYASYDDTSSGALHMDIDGMFAVHHSRVTSEKVTITTKNLREQGVCTYKAPVGYLNQGTMDEKPMDPIRAPLIKELFERYDTGEWTLASLERWAKDVGFTMPAMRRRRTEDELLSDDDDSGNLVEKIERSLTYNSIHKILGNRFYTGYIKGTADDQWIKSISHEPIVSTELFESVQNKLGKKKVSKHYSKCLELGYRKFVRCSECNRVYTPYEQKNILYFGSKCKSDCINKRSSLNVSQLEESIGKLIGALTFKKEEIEEFEARVQTGISLLEEKRHKEIGQIERKKKRIREDLRYLHDNKLTLLKTGAYTPENYLESEGKLNDELKALQTDETISDEAMHKTIKDIVTLSELLENVGAYYEVANTVEREKIARIIFSELKIDENTLQFKLTPGMKPFEKRLLAVCDPLGWLSELYKDSGSIKSNIQILNSFSI
jgi:site-specific DNA recombinase